MDDCHLFPVALVGWLLYPLVWDTYNVQPPYVFVVTGFTAMAVCFESLKSPATLKEDEDDIHLLMFPLYLCIESFVLMILDGYTDWSHTFTTSLTFGWGIISLWIIFLRTIHRFLPEKWNDQFTIVFGVAYTRSMITKLLAFILIACFRVMYATPEHWLVKNIYDIAFTFLSADILKVSSFNSCCFSMLVTTTFVGSTKTYFMCNYFDILGPGTFIAFLLRFDIANRCETVYFCWSVTGYSIGLALKLYTKCFIFSVPICTIGAFFIYCIWKGDNQQLLTFKGSSPEVFNQSTEPSPEMFNEEVQSETFPKRTDGDCRRRKRQF